MNLCSTCHAGCCRSFAVPVTGADIWRIRQKYALPFWDFVCRWADPQGAIARNHAPQFYFADEPGLPFVICLLHAESQQFPGTSRCLFLREAPPSAEATQGTAACALYGDRPSACRAFPARLNPTGDLAILYDIPPRGRDGENPVYNLCPRPWTPADVDPVQQLQDLVVAKYEMNFFHCLAQSWNAQPGQWSQFPEFLELVYSRRVLSEHELPESTVPVAIPLRMAENSRAA